MLDWMKKLFNKEEEQTAMNKEVPKQIESQPKIPRVNHYTEAREAQMASRNAGKCRFPLVPDNGFDEEDESEVNRFEEQPVQGVTYEEPTAQRGIKVERSRRPYVEKVVSTYEEPEVQYEPVRESVVKKASTPAQESNRRPFRPTEMISPIYGYNRPSVEKKEEKQEEVKEREDLEISVEGKSVVDAWLEKKGYTLSDFSEGQAPTSSSHRAANQQGEQQYKENKKEEKSVVDQWLEKNGYEIERQVPLVEEKEVIQEMSTPQEVSADELLHKTVAEQMESAKLEKDVVVLNENNLQEELVASKVEHEDTILSEEIKRNTEIKQPTIEVEKQAPEESVIVKAEEKLEETIIVEIPEEVSKVEVIAETEEFEEVVMETEAPEEVEVITETEESEEAEVIAEAEESEEVEVITETEELEEVEVIAEAEESEEVEVITETEELEEVEVIAETEELEEVEVITETEESEEAEVIAEVEESEEVEVIAEAEESEEAEVIAEINAPVVETFVALEEIQQEDEAIEQKSEFIHVAEADEQTKKDVQSFADVLIAEEQPVVEEAPVVEKQPVAEETLVAEEQRVVEEAPVAEEQQVVEEAPVVEEQSVVEEAPVVEEQPVAEETPVAEEQPVVQKEEPKREKKRHVPFNVVMLKQDRTRLMERHAARANAMQPSANVRVENKPVQQEVAEPQVEERPVQQVAAEPQMEEHPVQQVVAKPQVEEQTMKQVVAEPQVEERPVQQVVAEPQVEEHPVQQVVAEPQVEEQPIQQVVVEQVQKPISSTEVQEKAYVVNQRENDMRNVLHTPPTYTVPPLALLSIPQQSALDNTEWLEEQKELLDTTFNNFHVGAHVINVSQGPAVTRFEVQPDPGVKVNKITNLSDDIKLSLAAKDIRIEAPIPGKSAIGIEVPNKESKPVFLREILRSPVFTKSESPLTVALGLDISGDPIVTDIRKMPHGLIAGATGSGKSVCINAILTSILYKAKPHEVKLMLIDPKMVELAPYNSVPHLVAPVITDVKAATAALKWAVEEMERRYELFAHAGARDLTRYNTIVSEREIPGETLPYIVIVIDELADLMMVAPGDVEEAICRIAQKARACGIHLLVATQRPSVDVITGLIKSNIPTRIAFTVSSQVDSRTIIDIGGAEKLLGRGDMLFLGNGTSKPVRVQGVYVSDDEIEKTVDHVKKQMKPNYLFKQEDLLAKTEQAESEDELFLDACQFVVEQGGASTSSVQRKFRIGYNRAARLIEEMESQGIISEGRGTKPRDVLISEDEFAAMQETNV
ncbi:DNA translocase FtsK [Bacillus cereus]|uniref:DNA translocase FtsK n=1 Tax=Bacillus thuringiensis TaxID=1428 RepID=A0A643MYI4_BACTU|nr:MULTISPECIES: DNA translocase FtsK [Bacillus cereus group]AHZ53534.1 cell division protein FtsK [Bacillus thuringiensis serovar kurstaki str. YBT-1520]AIM29646.1 cell division FtsK/SpoIIIE [Bacillus thuringiensis serovar kurstaki str. YBT-1520]AJK43782.1 ftsK/SpoIIIE family protein [Bacillus thuringiensis serovar kurstaki]AKJ60233.1 cell division protein FtsK [Bacillus thuringiensis]ALL57471.1 cell division protein FtsK [Bacillus thuringiensis]